MARKDFKKMEGWSPVTLTKAGEFYIPLRHLIDKSSNDIEAWMIANPSSRTSAGPATPIPGPYPSSRSTEDIDQER